jgi:hypothetical protein
MFGRSSLLPIDSGSAGADRLSNLMHVVFVGLPVPLFGSRSPLNPLSIGWWITRDWRGMDGPANFRGILPIG